MQPMDLMNAIIDIQIPADHPAFAGHFPGQPIVPAVVLLDAALHAIADHGGVALERCTLDAVKFKAVIRPGQALTLHYEITGAGSVAFEIRSAERVAALGTIAVGVADRTARGE